MSRRRYVYRRNESGEVVPVEVTQAAEERGRARIELITDGYMANDCLPDGTPLDSRAKRRDYMRAHGLADTSDFGADYHERRRASAERDMDRERRADLTESLQRLRHRR